MTLITVICVTVICENSVLLVSLPSAAATSRHQEDGPQRGWRNS